MRVLQSPLGVALFPARSTRRMLSRGAVIVVHAGKAPVRRGARRAQVTLIGPGEQVHPFISVSQTDLEQILKTFGALGFEVPGPPGSCSRRLAELPKGGAVRLVMPGDPSLSKQHMQPALDTDTYGMVLDFLRKLAAEHHQGSTFTPLPTTPYMWANGQDYVQFGAAGVAQDELYVGEYNAALAGEHVADMWGLLVMISAAVQLPCECPDLAQALEGVTRVRLVLVGNGVREGLEAQSVVSYAIKESISIALPTGAGLGLAGPLAPALPLYGSPFI